MLYYGNIVENKVIRFILILLFSAQAFATECNTDFTPDQIKALQKAYQVGQDDNLGLTLAAIVWKESFVGKHIVRVNPQSGQTGSWGLTHIQLSTAAYLLGEDDIWVAKAEIVPKLINNDSFALALGLEVLKTYKKQTDSWRELIASYNAGPGRKNIPAAQEYANSVADKVKYLQKCHNKE